MKIRRYSVIAVWMLLFQSGLIFGPVRRVEAEKLPAQLTDEEFWRLSSETSEPDGNFRSDNLLSNESYFQFVIPELKEMMLQDRVYMGVGPEQNFTYIAALKPRMAFIVDIRRGNLQLQLMYKALFELSSDRADFVSRLFSRKTPEGLGPGPSAQQIFDAVAAADASDAVYDRTLKAIEAQLSGRHGFALSQDDINGIEHVFHAFYTF